MKLYLVYTEQGLTFDYFTDESYLPQVIGFYKAESPQHAARKAQTYLKEAGNFFDELRVRELYSDDIWIEVWEEEDEV